MLDFEWSEVRQEVRQEETDMRFTMARTLTGPLRPWEGNSIWVFMVVLRSGRIAEI
jgi:hypothetical protein